MPEENSLKHPTDNTEPEDKELDALFERIFSSETGNHNNSKESALPTTALERLTCYGELAWKTIFRAYKNGQPDYNAIEDISKIFCKLRGAALKLAQFISIQDDQIVNPTVAEIFNKVRQNANYLPFNQINDVFEANMGSSWRSHFKSFDDTPFAAASIGQVHKGVTDDGQVAIKVQYPGVRKSIETDMQTLLICLKFSNAIPKDSMKSLEQTVQMMKKDLINETDYIKESENQQRFRNLLENDNFFVVPKVHTNLSSESILTADFVEGNPVDYFQKYPQELKEKICSKLFELFFRELFEFRFMQCDPNWSNYLYNENEDKLYLLDFGSCKQFSMEFTGEFSEILNASSDLSKEKIISHAENLKLLNSETPEEIINSFIEGILIICEPLQQEGLYSFKDNKISTKIVMISPIIFKDQANSPTNYLFSIMRKMSGIYSLCVKFEVELECRKIFNKIYKSI